MSKELIARTPKELAAWLETAQRGERFVYAVAFELPRTIGAAARTQCEKDLITLALRRDRIGEPFEFLAIRTSKPLVPARPKLDASEAAKRARAIREKDEQAAAEIMAMLIAAATRGDYCPTNLALAEGAGLASPSQASRIVCQLRDSGRIEVDLEGERGVRVVTIMSSGLSTRSALQGKAA